MNSIAIWILSFLAIAGVIFRPFRVPEIWWALAGALLLVLFKLLLPSEALTGIYKGVDVYLFLTGMMLLAETAREEKLFDWLALHATRLSNGSPARLFLLIYVVGTLVTVFLSNDATAVVLTPAVAAAARVAKVKTPLPYLLVCAFIANAASFVLPISNPANLVIYGSRLPGLLEWVPRFAIPSVVSISLTFFILRWTQRVTLQQQTVITGIQIPALPRGGKLALAGIAVTAVILLLASGLHIPLGWPTAVAGVLTSGIVVIKARKTPWTIIRGISWSVIPLVAGLFVIVEALGKTGIISLLAGWINNCAARSVSGAAWSSGLLVALGVNMVNNLPAGLIAGNALQVSHAPGLINNAVLIGIDLGPNLSVTGSLATILWLLALRREGIHISAWDFLKIGILVMTIALLGTLAATIYI